MARILGKDMRRATHCAPQRNGIAALQYAPRIVTTTCNLRRRFTIALLNI